MTDLITLPRKHIDYAAHALEHFNKDAPDPLVSETIHHLRTALAAQQPKQEPVAWMFVNLDGECEQIEYGTPPTDDDSITPLYIAPPEDEALRRDAERYQWRPLYAAPPDAPTVKESLTHPGYVIGSHWLETAYSRICAGEAEADVLRDCGWERVDGIEALRRDAERYRWLRERAWFQFEFEGRYGDSGETVQELDAAIDAAMKEDKT